MATREELKKRLDAKMSRGGQKKFTRADLQARLKKRELRSVAEKESNPKTVQIQTQPWTPALPGSAKLAMQNTAMERAKAEQERKHIEVESNIRSQTLHENIEHSNELVEKREKEAEANHKMLTVKERNLLPKNERADFNVRTYDFAAGDDESERLKAEVDAAKATLEKAKRDNLYYTDLTAYIAASNAYDEANARYKAFEAEHRTKGYELEALRTKDSVRRLMSTNVSDIDAAIAKLEAKSFGLEELEAKKKAAWSEFSAAHYVGGTYRANAESEYDKAEDEYNKALSAKKENEVNIYYLNGIKTFSMLTEEQQEEIKRLYGVLGYAKPSEDEAKANMKAAWASFQGSGMSQDDYFRMVETLQAMDNALTSSNAKIENAKFANEYPITASTISVFANLLGGVVSVADVASHTLSNIGAKPGYVTPIDKNASTFALTKGANMMRGEVSAKIERSVGGVGGKIASFLYQTGMSGVDSFTASFTGNWGGALLLGSGAASNAFLDAKERGVSDSQAIWTGLLAGTFESLFERVSIGNINALKEVPPATVKAVLSNVAKSAGVNAFEEGVTEAANLVSDYFINLDKSALSQTYDGYVKQGMSESRAKWATFGSILGQTISAGIGGAIMGVGMSGSVGTVGYLSNKGVNTAAGARYIGTDGNADTAAAEALINLGKASANETIRNYATKLGKNVAKLDIKELGQLQRMLNAEKGADAKPKTIDLPNGMKPNDVVTIMEDDGSLRVMTAEDAAAAGKFEPIGSQKRKTGTNLQNGEKTPTSENLTVRGVSGDLEAEVKKTVRHVNAASAMSESADVKVYSALSGTVNNAVADNIANTPELSAAFEKMLGVKFEGSLSQKRKVIKDNALRLTENYRFENSKRVTDAVKRAEFGNDSELMLGAVGDFGSAIYRTIVDKGVRAAAIKGVLAHQQFNADFGGYYIDGYKGRGFAYNDRIISEADARAVYNAAARDAALANATSVTERSGIIAGATKENIALIERLSKALKRDILFVNMPTINGETFNGCYSKDGKIYINVNAKDALVKVVAHEFTHSLESRGLYGTFLEFVFDTLAKEGKTKEQLIGDKRNSASVYKNKSDPELEHEIVAQFVEERLLTDEKVMRDIVRTKGKPFAQKLHDMLNSLIEKIKAVFGKNTEGWTLKQLNAIEKGRKMLAEVIKSEDVGSGEEKNAEVRYDVSMSLEEQIKRIHDPKNDSRTSVYFGETPMILKKIGLKSKPILASPSHLRENISPKGANKIGQHGITEEQLLEIPRCLRSPVMIMDSMSDECSIVVVTDMFDADGAPIIISIKTDGEGYYKLERAKEPANFITSVYGKNNFYHEKNPSFLQKNVEKETLLYINEKKSQELFRVLGVQSPVRLKVLGFNKIIRQSRNIVNTQKFSFSVFSNGDGEGGAYSGKTLYADGEVYDYDFLVSLPDMNVVDVANLSTLRNNGEIDRDIVVRAGKSNAGSDRNSDAIVKNRYTKHELTITNKSIYHGLNGEHKALMTNSRIAAVIGDIVKNAVPINGLKNESKDAIGTYAMAVLAKGEDGRNFVAIVTVEVKTGNVKEVFFEDVVHSLKGRIIKKESDLPGTKPLSSRIKSLLNENHSTISIADFLEIVNITHQSILSNDVLQKYGEERNPKGYYADSVLFSVSSNDGEGGSSDVTQKKNSIRSIEHKFANALGLTEKESKAFLKKYLHPLTLKLKDGEAPDIDMLDNLIKAANEIKADSAENEVFSEFGTLSHEDFEKAYANYLQDVEKADKPTEAQEKLYEYAEEYGVIKPGENPVREVELPTKTSDSDYVSWLARTVMEAGATPESMLPTIEEMVASGEYSRKAFSDDEALEEAREYVLRKNFNIALAEWFEEVGSGKVSKRNVALGWTLYNNAANSGDYKCAVEILTAMVGHQKNAAQALQATRILKKMSPEAQFYAATQAVDKLQKELNEKYGDKAPRLHINPELMEIAKEGYTPEQREKALQDIYRDIGRQMPSTVMDKWTAWRYLAMLGNPRTHIRNIVGNAVFAPVVAAKNFIATNIEMICDFASGGKMERTKAFVLDRELLKAAWADYTNVEDAALGDTKYSEKQYANKYIEEGRTIFPFKPLEAARRGNSKLLDMEDSWFSKPHYTNALAQYCKANGITAEQVKSGKGLDKAREYAIKEAQKATYRDTNSFSALFSKLGRINEQGEYKKIIHVWNQLVEGVLPFRKTPANILARGVEYSPVGLLFGIKNAVFDVKNGKVTSAEAIDKIAAGLTGTVLAALGAFLVSQGVLRGIGGDDEEKKEFEELMGHQTYALEIGGISITLDWLAPEALPFFVGANIAEEFMKDGEMSVPDLVSALTNISDPIFSMSCLQSFNNMFDAIGYAKTNGTFSVLVEAATSYLTQGIPTLLGQFERTFEDKRMTTYTTKSNKLLTPNMQYTLGKASSKIPLVDYSQIPYIDAWGRTEASGNAAERAVNNMLNPAYVSKVDESDMENELLRLYEQTGEGGVLPERAQKYFYIDGEQVYLTAEQYQKYATEKGKAAYSILTALTKSDKYNSLDDLTKVEIVTKVYTYTNAIAKANSGVRNSKGDAYTFDKWILKTQKTCENYNIDEYAYLTAYIIAGNQESLKIDGETIDNSQSLLIMEAVYDIGGFTQEQYKAMFTDFNVGKRVINYNKKAVQSELSIMRMAAD